MSVPLRLRPALSALVLLCALPVAAIAQDAPDRSPPPPEAQPAPAGAPQGEAAPEQLTDEAERRGLTAPEVQESLNTDPPAEGMIEPEVTEGEETAPDLYTLLQRVRSAPPGYDGRPIPRPNPLASEPLTEMRPAQPADMSLFPDGYVE